MELFGKDGQISAIGVDLAETRDHRARANEHEADEDIELGGRKECGHNRDAQDAGIRIIFADLRDDLGDRLAI